MKEVKQAAANLLEEMEKRGFFETTVYLLNDGSGFHALLAPSLNHTHLLEVEDDVQMLISKINVHQLQLIASM